MSERFEQFIEGYSVSDQGRIRNDSTGKFRTLQERDKRSGCNYKSVHIRGKNYSVHRLVATYFVTNSKPEEYDVVRHLDSNPANNVYTNLVWGTTKENIQDELDRGTHTSLWNKGFINQINAANKPGKARKKRTLPMGVSEVKQVKAIKYMAKMTNEKCGQVYLGIFTTPEEAYEKVKSWYKEQYGTYPKD